MNGEPVQAKQTPIIPWPGLAAYNEQATTYFYGRGRRGRGTVAPGPPPPADRAFWSVRIGKDFAPAGRSFPSAPGRTLSSGDSSSRLFCRARLVWLIRSKRESNRFLLNPAWWTHRFHARMRRSGLTFIGGILQLHGLEGQKLVPVLVFDQFEEIFTLGESGRTSPSHLFLTELSDLVENRPPTEIEQRIEADLEAAEQFEFGKDQYRILLSLREDYLPHLEDLRVSMPSLTQNRVRLNRMTDLQAVDAVLGPGGDLVSPSLAQEIVRFVSGANSKERNDGTARIEVEPSLLSLVCHELNNKRRVQGQKTITADLLAGSSDAILHDFYERCLADQGPAVRCFVEDQLLTDSGFRESIALERARKFLEQQGAPATAVDQLIDRRLLHVEERLNVRRVELTHDVLTGVVKSSRNIRLSREDKEKAEHLRELAEEQRRQAEERERRTRRALRKARMTAGAFGVLLVAALVAAGWALWAHAEAKRETKRAVEAEREAKRERNRAVEAEDVAVRQKELAQRTAVQARERILDYNSTIVNLTGPTNRECPARGSRAFS